MSKFTEELMKQQNVKPEDIHLPAGGVAVFGRSGTGKSSLFYHSRFIGCIIVADTGSMAHRLYARNPEGVLLIDSTAMQSPIEQVQRRVEECAAQGTLFLLDSWTTLQEAHVAWVKRGNVNKRVQVSLQDHQQIVGRFRDLALVLAQSQGFTVFNTTPGGRGKTPAGEEVVYPAGAVAGYPSLNGTAANSETILARWGSVWGVFQGHPPKELPRGLYVPGADIRPESHAIYSPLKDPMLVVRDTSEGGKGIMAVPDLRNQDNHGRCFVDELLVEIAAKFRKKPALKIATEAPTVPAPVVPDSKQAIEAAIRAAHPALVSCAKETGDANIWHSFLHAHEVGTPQSWSAPKSLQDAVKIVSSLQVTVKILNQVEAWCAEQVRLHRQAQSKKEAS